LLAQDGLVPIELTFQEREVRLDTLLVYRLAEYLLERCLSENVGRDWVELRILHARRLLESRTRLGLCRDQLRASSERGEIAADGARLEELEAVLQLLDKWQRKTQERASDAGRDDGERDDARLCMAPGRKAGARGAVAACARQP
jgi:hypothetical protein